MRRLLALLLLMVPAPVLAQAPAVATIVAPRAAPGPAPGPVRVVGGPGPGCIAGAERLPDSAPGIQTVRLGRSTFWGHPDVIAGLKLLGERARAAGLPDLYMNDISAPRGGPLPGGHASHQLGLDADVYLDISLPRQALSPAAREAIEPPSLVRGDQRGVDAARWKPGHVTLLRLATALPGVDRVLVNAAIKRQLCLEVPAGARDWLRRIRPWYGHASHMHIHFRCPAGQGECRDLPPIPPGDGCDASLQWWFDRLDQPASKPVPRKPQAPRVPAACGPILTMPAAASTGRR
ncbi:MAG: penicillin-insensitive murein endopeptidase [Acetobacteraceae bacterium]|nr:penicillin-insensitive murein endopeptidase [Acetobacteraceae bacterium]